MWDKSVKVFAVFSRWMASDETWGTHARGGGRIYLDMHPREGKSKWFSECSLVAGVAGRQIPEASLVCNFPEPTAEDPGLMQYSDVVTYFHEFGHLLHEVLGGRQRWAGQSGDCHGRRFRGGAFADAGGVLRECGPAAELCAALPDG